MSQIKRNFLDSRLMIPSIIHNKYEPLIDYFIEDIIMGKNDKNSKLALVHRTF